jgi:hypothetical protein
MYCFAEKYYLIMGVQTAQGSRILVTTLREYGDCKQADEEV